MLVGMMGCRNAIPLVARQLLLSLQLLLGLLFPLLAQNFLDRRTDCTPRILTLLVMLE